MNARRGGFTLVELLTVIAILLILAGAALAVFSLRQSDKMRSAGRIAQSAFLGAKDRALHAKDLRGVRLVHDTTDPNLITGFVYLQPLPVETQTGIQTIIDRTTQTVTVRLPAGSSCRQQDQMGLWTGPVSAFIGGTWYPLQPSGNRWVSTDVAGDFLTIRSVFTPFDVAPMGQANAAFNNATTCDLQLGNEVLPFHQPIALPSGCVIDLKYSAVPATLGDVMYSPRGVISGPLQAAGPLCFLLRDLRDATAGIDPRSVAQSQTSRGDVLVLAAFPMTGHVQVFEVDPTDANGDGVIDDLFAFAKQGKSAGR